MIVSSRLKSAGLRTCMSILAGNFYPMLTFASQILIPGRLPFSFEVEGCPW